MMSSLHHAHTHHSLWKISIDGLDKLKKPSDLEKENSQPNKANKLNDFTSLVGGRVRGCLPSPNKILCFPMRLPSWGGGGWLELAICPLLSKTLK